MWYTQPRAQDARSLLPGDSRSTSGTMSGRERPSRTSLVVRNLPLDTTCVWGRP